VSTTAAGETIEQLFGSVSVTLHTINLPRSFAASASTSPGYSAVYTSLIVSFAIRVAGKPIYAPFDAFAGLGDPMSVDVRELVREKRWRLKLAGGDASTAYCAVMEFDSTQIYVVNLLRNCQAKDPFVTKRYARVKLLN
jgi:hypothetical protein